MTSRPLHSVSPKAFASEPSMPITPLFRSQNISLLRVFAAAALVGSAACVVGCQKPAGVVADAEAPVHVDTAEVVTVDSPTSLRLTGTVKGAKESDLAANAAGRVLRTMVERGALVKKGELIAQLDTSSAALAFAEARVAVETSKTQEEISRTDCARYDQLKGKGTMSDLEYDQLTAKCKTAPLTLEAAKARQNIAAKNIGDGTIRAPFAGVISERYVDVGEYVQPSSKVVSISQVGELRLEFTVPEAELAYVKEGADVSFSVAAYPDATFHAKVRFISGAVRASTRDLVAEAVVVETDSKKLLPGMFADVALATGSQKLAAVPVAAVFERLEKKRVYVVTGGRLEERILQYGPQANGLLTVLAGVKAGEKVVVSKLAGLQNGARVE